MFPWTGVKTYLPAFLIVGEVAVSREPSCTELLPGVGVLIGLKMSRTKTSVTTLSSLPIICVGNVNSTHRTSLYSSCCSQWPLNIQLSLSVGYYILETFKTKSQYVQMQSPEVSIELMAT